MKQINNFKGEPLQSRATRNTGLRSHDFTDLPDSNAAHKVVFYGICAIGFVVLVLLLQGVL